MTLPRTAAEVLSGHVTLEVRCIDRVMLMFRQPRLQYGQGIHGFFCQHRGNRFVSSALMLPMTERFTAGIRHYIDTRRLDLVRFAKGQSKDQVAREYLAGHDGGECILFVGVAQEKTRVWRTAPAPGPGNRYPWLYQEQAMASRVQDWPRQTAHPQLPRPARPPGHPDPGYHPRRRSARRQAHHPDPDSAPRLRPDLRPLPLTLT